MYFRTVLEATSPRLKVLSDLVSMMLTDAAFLLCPHVCPLCSCLSLLSFMPITWKNMKLALRSILRATRMLACLGSHRSSSKTSKRVTNLQTFPARNQWPGPSASSSSSCHSLQWELVHCYPSLGEERRWKGSITGLIKL